MKIFFILLPTLFFFSCGQVENSKVISDTRHEVEQKDSLIEKNSILQYKDTSKNIIDSLLKDYFNYSENDLVKLARENKVNEEALLDTIKYTDTGKYFVFNIGHDLTNKDGKKFITDSWIYIDSANGKVFEEDITRDSLIEWKRNKH